MAPDKKYHATFVVMQYHTYNQNPQLKTVRMFIERIAVVSEVRCDASVDKVTIKTVLQNAEINLLHEFVAENCIDKCAILYLDNNSVYTPYCNLSEGAETIIDYIKEREKIR